MKYLLIIILFILSGCGEDDPKPSKEAKEKEVIVNPSPPSDPPKPD